MRNRGTRTHLSSPKSRRVGGIVTAAAALTVLVPIAGPAFAAPERSLAGVHIFDSGSVVTAKFGNPSRILVGGIAPAAFTPGTAAGASGTASGSSQSGYPGSPGSSGSPQGAGLLPGFPGVPTGSPGGYPGGSSSEFPGAPGAGGAAALVPVKAPVTLIYDRQNGGSLEFTISPDKRVIQIRETGYSGAYGTSRGIRLGTSYASVVRQYGYPENTLIQGAIISTDYKDTLHCGFQFLDQKLVGIIVASPD